MDNSFSNGISRLLGAILAALLFVGLGVSLSGCPVAADLENEGRFPFLVGVSGSGPTDCNQPLDGASVIGCDYSTAVRQHCARGGCHNQATHSGDLDLTLDPLLIARILEVPSKHKINCAGIGPCDSSAPQCADCMMCDQVDTTNLLLTKADIPNSWMMKKMDAFNLDTLTMAPAMGCGTAMPYPPGGMGYTAERRDCLKSFFTWVANNGQACALPVGGSGGGGGAGGT